ncbi:hypothetical protein [Arthrobacter sp. VKM Ac-2550]|uniref:hypothetical protein n=1 Tax=Crystallibacter permensis TaxID=1938888 RepID=UPI0022261AEB|nr:hypothetical protein [Arthrobacter sp. VKM Ac-2550]MCW2132915.1 hypothetical protein [Arthrobacter sp. VKM Ac-2550]
MKANPRAEFSGIVTQGRDFDRLEITKVPSGLRISLTTHTSTSGFFNPADAPAIALAILDAAHPPFEAPAKVHEAILALEVHEEGRAERAKAEALTKRRDALADEFTSVPGYSGQLPYTQKLIDRIIELEQAAS